MTIAASGHLAYCIATFLYFSPLPVRYFCGARKKISSEPELLSATVLLGTHQYTFL
jgi:hypothetical protein